MTTSLFDHDIGWLYFAGFWMLLAAVAVVEASWPMHRSPLQPRGRLLTNFGMGLINMVLLALLPITVVTAAQWAQLRGFGLLNLVAVPWIAAAMITIIVRSLSGYLMHRVSHSNRLLWRIHRVHHCDVAIDLSTGFRNHPLEALFDAGWMMVTAVLFGLSPLPLAIHEGVALAISIWTHANLRLPRGIERAVRVLLVTPDMHHVHHSASMRETNSNYGDLFSFWDRLFKTYRDLRRDAVTRVRFGLDDEADPANLLSQLGSPLQPAPLQRPAG